jgi:hypothetical protein
LRRSIKRLKSWLTNWEEQYEYWKAERWIEKINIDLEKLIDELRRAIWNLKSGMINWEVNINFEKLIDEMRRELLKMESGIINWKYSKWHWKIDWYIEKSKISIEKLIDILRIEIWALKNWLLNRE